MKEIKEVLAETLEKHGDPVSTHKISFNSQQAQLEPIYYWILDFIEELGFKDIKKITDNFTASPGSGQFLEMNQRVTRMQEEGMKMMGALNQVVKSVLNLIYDLKEFEIRLENYDDLKSEDKVKKATAILSLKQTWLDNVDMKRGRGAIHQMANDLGFTTIREAFMMSNTQEDLDKIKDDKDGGALINDQVYRILKPRVEEFNKWVKYSEEELRKRYAIEKSYLKSQVETVKLYSIWMKPYLKAAAKLKQQGFEGSAALVNAFSTSMFELTILAKKEIDTPGDFSGYNQKRKYYACIMVNFQYRGHLSQRVTQRGDYGFQVGGKVDITMDSYSLNEEELELAEKKRTEGDVMDALEFEGDLAADALEALKEDLKTFLETPEEKEKDEKEKAKKEKKKKDENDVNPFGAIWDALKGLFTGFKKKDKDKEEIKEGKDIKPDNYVEKHTRAEAAQEAADLLYTLYDVYKAVHGMESSPEDFQNANPAMTSPPGVGIKDAFKGVNR